MYTHIYVYTYIRICMYTYIYIYVTTTRLPHARVWHDKYTCDVTYSHSNVE